jgi:predicted component of type VI protein secretion system
MNERKGDMSLVLQGIALNEEPLSQPLIGRFDERGGTVGRSDNATFTLPDPERMISRTQAQILYRDEGYWIENVSSANSILHNGRPLSAGMRVIVRDGDEIRIGSYTLVASSENDEATLAILRGRTAVIRPRPSSSAASSAPSAPPITSPAVSAPPIAAPPPVIERQLAAPAPLLSPAPIVPATAVEPDALWAAFQQGAGVELPPPKNGLTPEVMANIGSVLQTAVDGIHRLLSMRATAKDEMEAEMTMIQLSGNNPIKVAPDAAIALQLLLQPPARGFLSGREAIQETMIDLQAHLIGLTAGLRSALEAVLDRFDPAKVEAQLTKRSVLHSLMPGHHRAKLWELYLEHYRSLRDEAREDFQRLFGEAFRQAYEEQVRILEEALAAAPSTDSSPRDPQ